MKNVIKNSSTIVKRCLCGALAVLMMLGLGLAPIGVYATEDEDSGGSTGSHTETIGNEATKDQVVDEEKCARILTIFCPESDDDASNKLIELIKFVINLMTGGVVVAGAIGIMVCGAMWLTAGSNEQQVMKAKKRILEVTVGIVLFVMIDIIINLLVGNVEWK